MVTTQNPDTDALLALCRQGDHEARGKLLTRHRDRLRRMVVVHLDRRLSGRLDPSDIVQDALAQAATDLSDYLADDHPVPFYPWLRQIAWRRLVAEHRRHIHARRRSVDREQSLDVFLPDDSVADLAEKLTGRGTSPSGDAIRHELIRRVKDAIAQLKPSDQELIVQRHVEQLSVRDIAAVLGITEGAVKTRHFRVVQRLHKLLDGSQEDSR